MATAPRRSNASDSPTDEFFNDLSQKPPSRRTSEQDTGSKNDHGEDQPSKAKRIACVLCRKRKLRCDGAKPSCGTCKRLSHDCAYDEVRKKSGPKRGYVKALEARLAQVETMLKTQDSTDPDGPEVDMLGGSGSFETVPADLDLSHDGLWKDVPVCPGSMAAQKSRTNFDQEKRSRPTVLGHSGEIISLGLDEPMPHPDVVKELNQIYFERVHLSAPMIHPGRFLTAMDKSPSARPPVCLRYAMWALAAMSCDKYESSKQYFYERARKYMERDEIRGHGESIVSVAHVQAWILICTYEFKMTFFPKAWLSTGRASRLALMMGLHRLDGKGLDVKQCIQPPTDPVEAEERRRTFWMCFFEDRAASIGTGWPMVMDERDILTNLPVDEASFETGVPVASVSLKEALEPDGARRLSAFGGVCLMGCLFGRNLTHLHRPTATDNEGSLNGDFWRRHRSMDNIVLGIAMALPDHLRLPSGIDNTNIVFLNMAIHTSVICLHQAAIYKADNAKLSMQISAESKVRCITAASEIASIMRMASHKDITLANPFTAFCLYVAARVFVQYLRARSNDYQIKSSLHFLLTAMNTMKRRNPLTESFLVQLDVDLQAAGLEESRSLRTRLAKMNVGPDAVDGKKASHNIFKASAEAYHSKPPTFGNTGLSAYTAPVDVPMCSSTSRANPITAPQSRAYAEQQPGMERSFSDSVNRFNSMPSRQKMSSMDPSPGSDDAMDFMPEVVELSSNDPNQSSHGSMTSLTPPSATQDNFWDTYTNTERRAVFLGELQPTDDIFADPKLDFADMNYTQSTSSAAQFDIVATAAEAEGTRTFTSSEWNGQGTGLTPGNFGTFAAGTGLTPGPDGDMLNMSEADWTRLMDEGTLDMGWQSSPNDQSRVHQNPTVRRQDGTESWA